MFYRIIERGIATNIIYKEELGARQCTWGRIAKGAVDVLLCE